MILDVKTTISKGNPISICKFSAKQMHKYQKCVSEPSLVTHSK